MSRRAIYPFNLQPAEHFSKLMRPLSGFEFETPDLDCGIRVYMVIVRLCKIILQLGIQATSKLQEVRAAVSNTRPGLMRPANISKKEDFK